MQKKKMVVNPIIDWTHRDIWEYINSENIETCELYKCGYDRVGCIGCPMAGKKRWKEFSNFPKYKDMYMKAFDAMLRERDVALRVNGMTQRKFSCGGWKMTICRGR